MWSVRSRRNASSATCRIRSGRLSVPLAGRPSAKPNLVAITTWSRIGSSASSDEAFVAALPVGLGGVEERDTAIVCLSEQGDCVAGLHRCAPGGVEAHAAVADGGDFEGGVSGAEDAGGGHLVHVVLSGCWVSRLEVAVEVRGGDAAVDEEVAAGDERTSGPIRNTPSVPISSGVPARPAGHSSIMRR